MFPVIPLSLSVRHLTLTAGERLLLQDISFDVKKGAYLTVIGPNGAGKTTLLKCLDNILTGWSGEIRLGSVPLQTIPPLMLARRIAFVHQGTSVPFAFTVRQLVEMGRYPHLGWLSPLSREDRNIIDEAMETMGISSLAERSAETLSGGEMQKVNLAAALVQQADILFLDEPTTYLDYKYQSEIGQLLRSLNQQHGKTIIEVTHDVNRALSDATHVLAVSEGRIVFDGSPDYLMDAGHLHNIYGIRFQFVDHPNLPLKIVVPGV
ncbi:MAG: ABC transporter ATP-binding protein [Planctomycetaceae bacterium]|jgi:iron complex transport system ATP-binding protein|nr:ABC transporter ATP-binding protein [Planctomycetaceae bacterium]